MSIFNTLLSNIQGRIQSRKYARMMNGNIPVFSQFGNDIYMSDVVAQAVSCIVTELIKLEPVHTIGKGETLTRSDGLIQEVLDNPNPYMTTSDFLQKVGYQLFANFNSFVIPTYKTTKNANGTTERRLTAIYPIQPTNVTFLQDPSGLMAIEFEFMSGYKTMVLMEDVIHLKWQYHMNEFMGGDTQGQPNNKALMKTVQLNDLLQQSIGKSIKSSYNVNGIVKYKTLINKDLMQKSLEDLNDQLKNNVSGMVGVDASSELVQFKKDIKLVDSETLKFIDTKILRHFGVSLPILTGDYTKTQYEAFFQKTIEPVVMILNQSFTKGIFTANQRSRKNRIKWYTTLSEFMTTTEKLETARILGDSGTLFENEKRELLGYAPHPELVGVRKQSLNYVSTDIANEYQMNTKNKGKSKHTIKKEVEDDETE